MIGDTIWVFDDNHRMYEQSTDGSVRGPIFIEKWREHTIEGETNHSWILENGKKMPKNVNKRTEAVLFSYDEVRRTAWVHDNVNDIAERIHMVDFATLDAIAKLVDYPRLFQE